VWLCLLDHKHVLIDISWIYMYSFPSVGSVSDGGQDRPQDGVNHRLPSPVSSYRVQQVYTAQGRQWNIPGMYACIVFLPSTASLHCLRTAVTHTRYVCVHCLLTEYIKFTLLKDGRDTYQVGIYGCLHLLVSFGCQN